MVDELLESLGNPVPKNAFLIKIDDIRPGDVDLERVLADIGQFVNYFRTYLNEKDFQKNVFRIIEISLEICEKEEDLPDILMKTAIVNLIDLYITFSDISGSAKESVLNILGASFGKLDPSAQILNVCVMLDPVFKSDAYKKSVEEKTEVEVTYKDESQITDAEKEIKAEIDAWIKQQPMDVEKQDELEEKVRNKCKALAEQKGMVPSSPQYQELEMSCIEMVRMQLTSMALMFEFDDDDISPVPIN